MCTTNYKTTICRNVQTSAAARNIFAKACFTELESNFVRPKSSKIGRWGASLLTRKLPEISQMKIWPKKSNLICLKWRSKQNWEQLENKTVPGWGSPLKNPSTYIWWAYARVISSTSFCLSTPSSSKARESFKRIPSIYSRMRTFSLDCRSNRNYYIINSIN